MLDSQMFHLGRFLLPPSTASDKLNTVILPKDLLQNPDKIKQLRQALTKLNRHKAASVSLLSHQLPFLDYKYKEVKKSNGKKKPNDEDTEIWELTSGELTKLAWILEHNEILVGLPSVVQAFKINSSNSTISQLEDLIFSGVNQLQTRAIQQNYLNAPYSISQYNDHNAYLLWQDQSNTVVPDLSLAIYKQSKHIKNHDWLNTSGISLNKELIQTDYSGKVMTYFSENEALSIPALDLESLLLLDKKKIKNKLFILADNNQDLISIANRVNSLIASATFHTPAWANWLKKVGFVFVLIYLLVFIAILQKHTGYLLSLFLFFGVLVFQYGLLLTQSIWLPLISLYIFLLFGHAVVLLNKSMNNKIEALMLHTQEALLQLAHYQFDQGDHDKALANLLKCSPTSDVLELMYNIGLGFERRRQYDKALDLYSDLDIRDRNYKDVKQRLKSLFSVSGKTSEISSPSQAAQTLVMPDLGLQLPMLGRYELERELGRGAMGVVYLGKDPKINRQVAIKTLDYSQFSDTEIKTFKSRFFREAEAAGRLNHNNIVTVYDVGEEDDFAFIAMDYVNGAPLSDYSKPDTLLPVQEVYEIIATVAEALDYAHAQKIIHRDIKPGNIMYDANTRKIKITDFGIARITDNAHTRTGSFLGSPSYMAPEQMVGSNVDCHADIYALGVTFYQLLSGNLPFKADNIGNLAYVIANEKHKPIRDIRPDLPSSATRIINKALQKKPKDRYKSGKEMADAIRRGMPNN